MKFMGHLKAGLQAVAGLCAALAIGWAIVAPLPWTAQALFGLLLVSAGFVAARTRTRHSTVLVCVITFTVASRYMVWRLENFRHFSSWPEAVLAGGLLLAEAYGWLVMVLSFVQTARPLRRPVAPLAAAAERTPSVDVYIPTYNEPLSVVGPTVIAAMAMDYPADRFRVFILDDGARPEVADFARRVGSGYLARSENTHAKAGNLNAAMKCTDGELVCILDCDHVPTRAFLQLSVGWFEKDPKLALVQTPHFFYSPDPVQRNVKGAEQMPGEGDLFYDAIQSGNDLWNAAFFCGSCAVIRRDALNEVGGFAYETVTEDAHTALKIQRRGWNTAFLNIRISAGLATETLGQLIGQRARWCRGMTQILRLDNPLFGPGLSLAQRLCYLNSLLYYQFPLVRIVLLTSPLAYLLFGLNLLHASAQVVLVYAAPHLLQGLIANHRLQGKQRRMFWGEIYETIFAFHLVRPAVMSLINPAAGKFNVTDKGMRLEEGYFDRHLARPQLVAAALLVIGVAFASARLMWPQVFHESVGTLLLNLAWTSFNLMILLSAIAVAREGRQVRASVRRSVRMPVTLYFADGRVVDAVTSNVSTGGLAVDLPKGFSAEGREVTHVDLQVAGGWSAFPVQGLVATDREVRLHFVDIDEVRERRLIQALMARADAWQPEPRRAAANGPGTVLALDVAVATMRFITDAVWRQARVRLQRAGAAACLAGAIAVAAGLGSSAHAAATVERAYPLDQISGFPAAGGLTLGCGRTAPTGRLDLAQDAVVLGARLEFDRAPTAAVVTVNGQRVARVAHAGRLDLEPAVFLPGANEIRLAAGTRAACGHARLAPADGRLVLTLAPLVPAPVETVAPAPKPKAIAAAPAPAAARHPAAAKPESDPALNPAGLLRGLAQNPFALALLAVAAAAVLSRILADGLERQAVRRLDGLAERPA
jgi:cellulose synthase (UDP-forming)